MWHCSSGVAQRTIADFIVAVIINAVQRQAEWARPKLRVELLEAGKQKSDPATAIVGIAFSMRVTAPLLRVPI